MPTSTPLVFNSWATSVELSEPSEDPSVVWQKRDILSQWKPTGGSTFRLQCVPWNCDYIVWPPFFMNHFQTLILIDNISIENTIKSCAGWEKETSAVRFLFCFFICTFNYAELAQCERLRWCRCDHWERGGEKKRKSQPSVPTEPWNKTWFVNLNYIGLLQAVSLLAEQGAHSR